VATETALAHARLIGQDRKRKIIGQMAVDPAVQRAEPVVGSLQGQGGAELCLPARTLEENDEVAGNGERHGTAEVLFHQRQRQIDPGRHSGRTVAYEDRIGLDMHGRKALGQLGAIFVPGGYGQEALMEDAEVLGWIRQQASGACSIFLGVHGRAHLRRGGPAQGTPRDDPLVGVSPVAVLRRDPRQRTGGRRRRLGLCRGRALRLAAELRGDEAAQAIQLHMVYAPEPPFDSGTPETAPVATLKEVRRSVRPITAQSELTARRVAAKLGIAVPAMAGE
jgi:cyclohexyl-isocyanide hydratase